MEKRDIRLDFLRGAALMMIFADHVPHNLMSLATLQSFAFADAAELFFFLSGFVAAMVYGRTMDTRGFFAAAARIWRRAWDIYAAQMVLLFFFVAEVCAIASLLPATGYFQQFRVEAFITQTETTVVQALMLRFQPAYLDILPVYTVFFAILPLVLVALKRGPWLVILASALIYAGTQLFGWNATTHPSDEGWFFNPFAWQFLMVIGAALGSGQLDRVKHLLFTRPVLIGAGAIALVAAVMQFTNTVHAMFPIIPTLYLVTLPTAKTALEPLRLISFFSAAILVAHFMPSAARMARIGIVRALARCGRHSLAIFCIGILLAVVGQVVWLDGGRSLTQQAGFSALGIGLMMATAWLLDWVREGQRALTPIPEPGRASA